VEPPGTAPGSDPRITGAFIAIVRANPNTTDIGVRKGPRKSAMTDGISVASFRKRPLPVALIADLSEPALGQSCFRPWAELGNELEDLMQANGPRTENSPPCPERYDEAAMNYLMAAETLLERENRENLPQLIAPCSQCLAQSLELFLKARLLESGRSVPQLKEFGHSIYQMWMLPEFAEMRAQAQVWAISIARVNRPANDPNRCSIDETINKLDELYGNRLGPELAFALRYPKGRTEVLHAQPLLGVLGLLFHDPRWSLAGPSG
jgi:hypothetical protein